MARPDRTKLKRIDRRGVLTGLAASAVATSALAQADDPLQQLIQQNQRGGLGRGVRLRLAHHPHAEGLAADARAGDRAAHRDGDRALRAGGGERRLAAGAGERSPAHRRAQSGRHRAAPAAEARGRSRPGRGRERRLRFLCRDRGAALPGAPRPLGRRAARHAHLQCAQRPGRPAAEPAQDQSGAAARLRHQAGAAASSSATSRPRSSRRSRTAP